LEAARQLTNRFSRAEFEISDGDEGRALPVPLRAPPQACFVTVLVVRACVFLFCQARIVTGDALRVGPSTEAWTCPETGTLNLQGP